MNVAKPNANKLQLKSLKKKMELGGLHLTAAADSLIGISVLS